MKRILITGATDGIGLETAKSLYQGGHSLILHGRSEDKLIRVKQALLGLSDTKSGSHPTDIDTICADLSKLSEVDKLVTSVREKTASLDVIINNAGVYTSSMGRITSEGLELRFAVNAIAPYILTQGLLPLLTESGRVVNVASAAQASITPGAIKGSVVINDSAAYAQSKLLLILWTQHLGRQLREQKRVLVSVNPKSFLGSKMVKDAYGVQGGDIAQGADILVRASLSDDFSTAYGDYFDNDIGRFAPPHPDASNEDIVTEMMALLDALAFQERRT